MLGKLFWVVLFLVFTFAFNVLFEYGPSGFVDGAKKDFETLKNYVMPSDAKKGKK